MPRAAVLGKPIEHSLSPVLHRAAYRALGLDDWSYDRFEVDAAGLADFVGGLDLDWRGLSLTMPLKQEALLLASQASPLALQTGAVNTLVRTADGWVGDNTDVHGIATALLGAGLRPALGRAVVIGSGATARSVLAALHRTGIREVTFMVRDQVRPSTAAQARDHGMSVTVTGPDDAEAAANAPLLVSTVPAGAADTLAERIAKLPPGEGSSSALWLDVVYAGWPTPLARAGAARGATVVAGVEMLIHQAAEQVRLMTGMQPPLEAMIAAARAAIGTE